MTTIATIANKTGISSYNIRFYEKEGLLSIPRTKTGIRNFDIDSETRLYAIRHYRRAGLSLAQIKEIFANTDNHEMIIEVLKDRKSEMKKELYELETSMAYLEKKIKIHKERLKSQREVI
ncbi:MerR family transcriptional regulator [Lactococcus kimchii]|uniref:MerR family transcriptional regulator n=1 Tax=Lactococcus sp. S-13 TaxID=2507158 RepID=UPI001022AFB9|nr:MerR family transcriptional regulator [Lactococcus sp. S-13]RZI49623.1 MerR family transcriptional regulator [Lactococcus sp. S-13]